jgi:hypothetical protein
VGQGRCPRRQSIFYPQVGPSHDSNKFGHSTGVVRDGLLNLTQHYA